MKVVKPYKFQNDNNMAIEKITIHVLMKNFLFKNLDDSIYGIMDTSQLKTPTALAWACGHLNNEDEAHSISHTHTHTLH